ncbi:capsular biosynthesis protein [Oscillatoriales cyanobacterium USR001]|nr:capsular biosynthesis protein [Oscillatoriales cyanobacterium USR001]
MDNRQEFQPFLPKSNGKLPHLSPQIYRDKPEESEEEKLDLSWLFAVVRRRAPVMVAATMLLSLLAGGLIVSSSKKTIIEYEGSFALLVEPATAEGLLSKQLNSNTPAADLARINIEGISLVDYETQIRILKSPKMMMPVVKELQNQYPRLSYTELMSNLGISRISYSKDGKSIGTKILEVRYKDKDTKKIYEVLKKVKNAYITYSLEQRLLGINQGINFIEKVTLPKLQKRVGAIQLQLQRLRQERNFFEPTLEGRSLSDQVQSLRSQQLQLEAELKGIRTIYNNYQKLLDANNPVGILITQGQSYGGLVNEIQKVDSELSLKLAQYREDSLPIQALRKSYTELMEMATKRAQEVVMPSIASKIDDLEARKNTLSEAQNQLSEKLRKFAVTAREYDNLQQELQVLTKSLSDFLGKLEALRIDAAQQQAPWQEINPPEIPLDKWGRYIPATIKQTSKQLALAVILSSLLGIAIGLLVEVLNTVFHTPEEVRAAAKLPILGVIPLAKKLRQKRPPRPRKRSAKGASAEQPVDKSIPAAVISMKGQGELDYPFLEAFRSLYTNIYLMSSGRTIRSLLICSPVAGDGKSTVALHLAQTAAAVGQRVLLVDADLRYPQLHLKLGLPNIRGLSDAISSDLSLNDAIQRSPLEDNLFVLTAGHIPSDPIKLLSSKKMQYLMEQFQAFFDLVIYDTPPLVGLADGHLLGAHTDGTMMVMQLGQTDRSQVSKALDELKISGASLLGIVANGFKGTSRSSSPRPVGFETVYNNQLPVLGNKTPDSSSL